MLLSQAIRYEVSMGTRNRGNRKAGSEENKLKLYTHSPSNYIKTVFAYDPESDEAIEKY